jgi:signal transduction histidine kinase
MLKFGFLLLIFLQVFVLENIAQTGLPDSVKQEISAIREIEKKGEFVKAIEKLEPYLIKYRNHPRYIAYFYLRLGTCFCRSYKCKIGLSYFKKGFTQALQSKDTVLLGKSSLGVGAAYQFLEDYTDSALYFYSIAKPYLLHTKDSVELTGLNSNIAMLLENSPDKEYSYLTLVKIREEQADWLGASATHNNLGILYLEMNMPQKAYDSFVKSFTIADTSGFKSDANIARRGLIKASYYLGKTDEAFSHFLAYDSLTFTRLHSEDYGNKILELETKFKTAEIERDNLLKQAEIDEKELKLTFLYIAVSIVILLAIIGLFYLDQRRKRLKLAALRKHEKAQEQIKDLVKNQEVKTAYALLEGQDKERKRIAQDLHDNLGSILVTLNMYADTLAQKPTSEEKNNLAEKISKLALQANEETRNLSHSLDSGTLKHFGLNTALVDLVDAIKEAKEIEINLEVSVHHINDVEVSLNLYRIIQELFNNTLKHAKASKISLELTQTQDDQISLIYQDDGIGFNKNEVVEQGMGLANLKIRAENINGHLTIDSITGNGSTFIIEIENSMA